MYLGVRGNNTLVFKMINIEGSIGSGKSTILAGLKQCKDCTVYFEPVQTWSRQLRAFYDNPERYGLALQIKILTSFLSADKDDKGIIERSPLSSRYIFGSILYNSGLINDAEMDSYHAVWDALTPQLIQPTGAIYVFSDPNICFERTTRRARDEEKTISREYLHELHDAHEAVFRRLEQPVCKDVFQCDSSLYAKAVWIDGRNPAQQVLGAAERALNYLRA